MRQPISVAMAVYNGLPFLYEQMASVLAQLRCDDELLIVDDCSTDGSLAWLKTLNDSRIVLLTNERNLGVLRSFERALSACTRPVILLCDQDDIWLPGKRDAFVAVFLSTPDAMVVVSDAQIIDAEGKVIAPSFMATRGGFRAGIHSTLWRNRYLGCAMAVRREVIATALPIPRQVPMHDMWLGIVGRALGEVGYIPTPLLQYRRHSANASPATRRGWGRMLTWRLQLLLAISQRFAALWRAHRAL
jgi:glycosyltransferase involved in cell wall biosynthesis